MTQLNLHSVSKMSTAREGYRGKALAREALVERLEAIGRTARAIAEETPGFDDPFRLPRKQTDQTLLTAGRVFVHDTESCKTRFTEHGLPQTFVADLHELVEAFERAIRGREAARSAQMAAQAGIATRDSKH